MRLVDADKCPCIQCEDTRDAHCTYEHRSCKKFCDWLNSTAYDVDAVAEQVLEITRRIFNYCEEIDNNIPVDERTGYDMLADINLLRDVVIKGDVVHKITQTNDSNAAYIKGIDVCAKAFLDLVAYTNSELKEINEMLEKLKAGEADA